MERFSRTEKLIGEKAVKILQKSKVCIFGVGGVGGYAAEALCRAGIGRIDVVDADTVSESNINRQIIALSSTVGMPKVDVIKNRLEDINPDIIVNAFKMFYLPENSHLIDFKEYDYIVDAVDTVSAKIEIAVKAKQDGINIVSAMGAGNKLDATRFEITDLYKTSGCPLARVMRKELRVRGIKSLDVVYSKEEPKKSVAGDRTPSSISYVPSVCGLLLAQKVITDLIKE